MQIALQYTLPRLQATLIKEDNKDQPLFINFIVNKRKENSNEEKWEDNFESTSLDDL